jgi:hypothetical protein
MAVPGTPSSGGKVADFAFVPIPVCEPHFVPDTVNEEIHQWISSPPMAALVEAFGGSLPTAPTGTLLAWLDDFSGAHWDFRGGRERDQVVVPEFDPATRELILRAATALQLVTPQLPPQPKYQHLLVLGGLGQACLQRSEYAARLVLRHGTVVGELAALGSFRPLTGKEQAVPGLAASGYEVDAMDVGVRSGFAFTAPAHEESSAAPVTHSSWSFRTYAGPDDLAVHVLAAPSSEPGTRRANTPDTYEFWAQRVQLSPADRILVVTSPIYVPFQHADAIRMLALRHGCGIDTIGFDPAQVTIPMATGATGPDRYLQEIRSGILSMRRLHQAVTT